ncbi:solute carrier family protein [Reticulomyxa filosa]|uniref:Solute carrier family protein n=1 Tax=Reticulomyxa filosa TaxID=46433 RepID=X6P0R3_RETFI|nr:solute carrier family protein [Reticulomyxa filosa]|eukprot:ETO32155.1 solute carrier family protein [Reticulomyxa filosa]
MVQRYRWQRVLCVACSIVGVLLIELRAMNYKFEMVAVGALLAPLSAMSAALFKTTSKKCLKNLDTWELLIFLALLGAFNLLFVWPLMWIFDATGYEILHWSRLFTNSYDWLVISLSALCGLLFDWLVIFGVIWIYPLFISIGFVLGIPLQLVVDKYCMTPHYMICNSLELFLLASAS